MNCREKNIFKIFFLLALSVWDVIGYSQAQTTPTPPPTLTLLPWTFNGISAESITRNRDHLNQATQYMRANLLTNAKTLTETAQNPLTLNQKLLSNQMMIGESVLEANQPLGLAPMWCKIADQHVFILQYLDLQQLEVLAVGHQSISDAEFTKMENDQQVGTQFTNSVQQVLDIIRSKLARKLSKRSESNLSIGIALGKPSTREDVGHGDCFRALIAEDLVSDHRVSSEGLDEMLFLLRDVIGINTKVTRPTRNLTMNWSFVPNHSDKPWFVLPLPYQLEIRLSEGVLGNKMNDALNFKSQISLDDSGKVSLNLADQLKDFFQAQSRQLHQNAKPKVVKVYGAWAYLDQGRAFGLDMDQRLVVEGEEEKIKGHVVGFFGPKLQLKNAAGESIPEGAIVYIRKGQANLQVGQTMKLDEQNYPTPWPP